MRQIVNSESDDDAGFTPSEVLWVSVVRQGISDLSDRNGEVRRQAREWFTSDQQGPGSFRWILETVFNLDPSTVLRMLKSEGLLCIACTKGD